MQHEGFCTVFAIIRQTNSSDGLASTADRLKLLWVPMCCEATFIDCSLLISRFRIALAAVLLNCAIISSVTADTGVRVVASIKPVHSLVSAVMAGVDKPHLIMQGAMSPHTFSMRPSDAVALEDADVIFLIDEVLETSLANPIDTLASNARVVPLFHAQGLVYRTLREGGTFDTHDHHEPHMEDGHSEENEAVHRHDDSDDHISHDHSWHEEIDPHIWLDPVNAAAMVRVIADTLYKAHPANAELQTMLYKDRITAEGQCRALCRQCSSAPAPAGGTKNTDCSGSGISSRQAICRIPRWLSIF